MKMVFAAKEPLSNFTLCPTGVRSRMKSARAAGANEKAVADTKAAADNLRKLIKVVLLPISKFAINVTIGSIAKCSRNLSIR